MTTTKTNLIKSLSVFVVILFFLSSCGAGKNKEQKAIEASEKMGMELKEVSDYPIPTSVEVVEMLNRAGAPYIIGISNPVSNADKYFTEKSKALNLGVYGADLSYASTYEMKQETMNYLKVAKQLIDELNIASSFNLSFAQRVESNLENKDSLINIVADSFYDTYVFLTENKRDDLSLLVMAGSWIEGVYLTSQIAISASDNKEFLNIIAEQKKPLSKLLELIEPMKDEERISDLYKDLNDLKIIYENVDTLISPEKFEEISEKVEEIRTRITS
jgi:hypothetical protein